MICYSFFNLLDVVIACSMAISFLVIVLLAKKAGYNISDARDWLFDVTTRTRYMVSVLVVVASALVLKVLGFGYIALVLLVLAAICNAALIYNYVKERK